FTEIFSRCRGFVTDRCDGDSMELQHRLCVSLVVMRGAPAVEPVAAALEREAIDVTTCDEAYLDEGRVDRPLELVRMPADVDDARLGAAPARRERGAALLVLGCAPTGGPGLAERALALGFDDFVSGRSSGRELAARLRVLGRCRT